MEITAAQPTLQAGLELLAEPIQYNNWDGCRQQLPPGMMDNHYGRAVRRFSGLPQLLPARLLFRGIAGLAPPKNKAFPPGWT